MMRFLFLCLCLPTFLLSQTNSQVTPVFKIVEEMPQFQDCGSIKVLSKSDCFQNYVCTNLTYPPFAKKHGVQGEVMVSFIIDEEGKVQNAKITQDIGAGCGTATLDFVNAMPDWVPGKQRGIRVKVAYQLKVDYRPSSLDCR